MKKAFLFICLLGLAVAITGCISSQPAVRGLPPGEEDASVVGLYHLQTLDPLSISLLGIPEEKVIQTVIDEQGNITLPYIEDPVQVVGLTTSELERKIQDIYITGQIYRNITVNVLTDAKNYYMEGEIRRPQEYQLGRRITLLQAIASAGGYTEYANKKKVTITRGEQLIEVNPREIEENPEMDIYIEAGDRIRIHRLWY